MASQHGHKKDLQQAPQAPPSRSMQSNSVSGLALWPLIKRILASESKYYISHLYAYDPSSAK